MRQRKFTTYHKQFGDKFGFSLLRKKGFAFTFQQMKTRKNITCLAFKNNFRQHGFEKFKLFLLAIGVWVREFFEFLELQTRVN